MEEWKSGKMEEWKNSIIRQFDNGRIEEFDNSIMENGRMEGWNDGRIRLSIVFGGKMENFCVFLPTATGDCQLLSAFYSLHFALCALLFAKKISKKIVLLRERK